MKHHRIIDRSYQQKETLKLFVESCRHHPGAPFFHDAYKGWSCCNRKSVDFTEFLNMKGCTLSKHSNIKRPEPEQPLTLKEIPDAIKESKPLRILLKRPPYDSALTEIVPAVLPAVKEAIDSLKPKQTNTVNDVNDLVIGTACKNNGCKCTYASPDSDNSECCFHPGCPIFHEGMKFWSCCTKRTSDFTAFLNQKGCLVGKHKWNIDDKKAISCRYDWHQTPSDVIVAIYAKLYDYKKTSIKLNPIRLKVEIIFPEEDDAVFDLDLELKGIINVTQSTAKMFGTKIEITMSKAQLGTWSDLSFPKPIQPRTDDAHEDNTKSDDSDSDVNLEDIEAMRTPTLQNIT